MTTTEEDSSEIEVNVHVIGSIFEMALKNGAPWKILAPYIHDEAIDPPTRAWMCHRVLGQRRFNSNEAISGECHSEILKCLSDELQCIKKSKAAAAKPPLHPPRPVQSSTDGDKYKWFAEQ